MVWLPIDAGSTGNYNRTVMADLNKLSRFEDLIRRVVEGTLDQALRSGYLPNTIAVRLTRAMEDSAEEGFVASRYQVNLQPGDFELIQREDPLLVQQLTDYVERLVHDEGLSVLGEIEVELVGDETIGEGGASVTAFRSNYVEETTGALRAIPNDKPLKDLKSLDAFLIISGRQHISLDRPITTIGRQLDNDIVIEASEVSRIHAQIRWRYMRFVIYDLDSSAGTYVNGHRIREHILESGNVISLGNVSVIYGEGRSSQIRSRNETTTSREHTRTLKR